MWIGARGWSTATALEQWIGDNKLNTIEPESYSESIFKAKLEHFAQHDKPIIFYGYVPDYIHKKFELRLVNSLDQLTSQPAVDVHVARTPTVSRISPKAEEILKHVSFTVDDINEFIRLEHAGVSPNEIASYWIKEHPGTVAQWTDHRQTTGAAGK